MFYILEKIVKDEPNLQYSSCWNQQIIRPCKSSKTKYRKLIEGKVHGMIVFEGCVCHQEENETEDEFMLRASLKGYSPDFIYVKTRDFDWRETVVKVIDIEKDCEYRFVNDDGKDEVVKISTKTGKRLKI